MNTSIEISDPLLKAAKQTATRERTTLRALVEQGLRQVLEAKKRGGAFRLRRASFRGVGLQPPVRNFSWAQMRALVYAERGQ